MDGYHALSIPRYFRQYLTDIGRIQGLGWRQSHDGKGR